MAEQGHAGAHRGDPGLAGLGPAGATDAQGGGVTMHYGAPAGPHWTSPRRVFVTADRARVVDEHDPEAAYLLVPVGGTIPQAEAERLGLIEAPLQAAPREHARPWAKSAAEPETPAPAEPPAEAETPAAEGEKARAPQADKARQPGANK